MSIITSLKQQKDKNRVNVYLDDSFGFGIDLDNFVLLHLKLGQELTDEEVHEIVKKAEFQKTLEKIYRFATVRPRSEKEFKDWLYRKKVPNEIHKDLFIKLKYFEFLDDEKFARFWIESRNLYRPKPRRVLTQELRQKGINKEIVDKILNESPIDETQMAKNLIEKRSAHWEGIPKEKRGQKMLAYLVGKGFSFEIAKKALSGYNIDEDS
jgi:regulatory protein